jgi:hypothetical protein
MEFLHSVEFYVILLVIASFAVAMLAVPSGHGPVETDFAEGELSYDPTADTTPRLEIECQADGSVKIRRYGLPDGLPISSGIALAITRKAFDISIEERITYPTTATSTTSSSAVIVYPNEDSAEANVATFILSNLAHERYHIKYNSEPTSSFTTATLMNRPGLKSTRLFRGA